MTGRVEQASAWLYRGAWGVLTRWFRVPADPPTLPTLSGEVIESFQPAPGFLQYLKFQFWVLLAIIDVAIMAAWLALTVAFPAVGLLLLPVALFIAIAPDIVAYVAIHLRYDTTWYVLTDRSLRIRRGIWIIHETTITFENVQNVSVNQGPLQRYFGIADVLVETAGGGGRDPHQGHRGGGGAHRGLIEGVADAVRIRDLLVSRMRRSRTAGLGDEEPEETAASEWTNEQLAVVREIRDAARRLVAAR